jgi:hypothetical protein
MSKVSGMQALLTFIIPVRHQDNARDWSILKHNLAQTIGSIAAQKDKRWKAVVVANHGADLPELPSGFQIVRVDFCPNPFHEKSSTDEKTFYEAVRIDKGRRILAGLLAAGKLRHVMIVDDDDFVSHHLTGFVAEHPTANGWFIKNGYVWADGGRLLYKYGDFSHFCGTSLIIRADLYKLPSSATTASDDYIKRMLGSHIYIQSYLTEQGTALAPLPFMGAVYRVGHAISFSKHGGIIRLFFLRREVLKRPVEILLRLPRLCFLTQRLREEFFGKR